MKRYRLYLIDLDRRVSRAEDFSCRSDALAIGAGDASRGQGAAELWVGGRRVKVYEAKYPTLLGAPDPRPLDKPDQRRPRSAAGA